MVSSTSGGRSERPRPDDKRAAIPAAVSRSGRSRPDAETARPPVRRPKTTHTK
ncbi:MAG TPA: hypothetical protein VI814_10850 [Candidatus Limnocylindria bacterium]